MKFSLGSGYIVAVHPEGRIFVVIAAALSGLSIFFSGVNAFSVLTLILPVFCISFFRDPERVAPSQSGVVVSPADGKLLSIEAVDLPPEAGAGAEMMRLSIFLSVFDVHVNRMPVSGKVIAAHYVAGKFLNASLDKASIHNERNTVVVETEDGHKVVLVQIAGLIARRIVSKAETGIFFAIGDRYGIIRFGSRVDVYVPKSFKLNVSVGQTMLGGETVLATVA